MDKSIKVSCLILALLCVVLIESCRDTYAIVSPAGPDLIIEKVSYERLPSCYQTQYGTLCIGTPLFKFTVRVRNIGDADLHHFFYVSNSRSDRDFQRQYCSHAAIVNYPTSTIAPNGFLDVVFDDLIDENTQRVLIVINANDFNGPKPDLPIIDESRYDNNSYTLELQW